MTANHSGCGIIFNATYFDKEFILRLIKLFGKDPDEIVVDRVSDESGDKLIKKSCTLYEALAHQLNNSTEYYRLWQERSTLSNKELIKKLTRVINACDELHSSIGWTEDSELEDNHQNIKYELLEEYKKYHSNLSHLNNALHEVLLLKIRVKNIKNNTPNTIKKKSENKSMTYICDKLGEIASEFFSKKHKGKFTDLCLEHLENIELLQKKPKASAALKRVQRKVKFSKTTNRKIK